MEQLLQALEIVTVKTDGYFSSSGYIVSVSKRIKMKYSPVITVLICPTVICS